MIFAKEQGFSLRIGNGMTLAGYDKNGEFKIGKVTNLNGGVSITLCDASGQLGCRAAGRRG